MTQTPSDPNGDGRQESPDEDGRLASPLGGNAGVYITHLGLVLRLVRGVAGAVAVVL
jgi:hypothetical protein